MAVARLGAFSKDLRTLYAEGSIGSLTDGQLLERFVAARDEAVFEALIERHGPMVLQICRGMLGNSDDAEDAFQATFLVLVLWAGSIRKRDSVASWLFGVAGRIAARARVDAARRRKHERRAAEMATRPDIHEERPDLGSVLREELARLPRRYRELVVLCCLEGLAPGVNFEFAEGLKWLALPGDWIVREGSAVEARLEAFQSAVKTALGRSIRCERRRVTRYGIVVSVRYAARPVSKERPEVHLSADNRDLDSEIGAGEGTLDELVSSLSRITGRHFIDEATVFAGTKTRWVQHDSSLERGRLAELLANLSTQTSLEFRRQERPVEVWSVTEGSSRGGH